MRYSILTLSLMCLCLSLTDFHAVESAYQHEDYQGAKDQISKILAKGNSSQAIYYNLSCMNYKMGHYLQAFIDNKKVAKFEPMNNDNNFNLHLIQKNFIEQSNFEPSVSDMLIGWASWQGLWGLSIVVWGVLIYLWVFFRNKFRLTKVSLVLVFTLLLVIVSCRATRVLSSNDVVVTAERIAVHSGPSNKFPVLYWVHQGLMGFQTGSRGEWSLVRLSNGDEGWIESPNLQKITIKP